MLRKALQQNEFVITCEFVPGRGREGVSVDAALAFAQDVSKSGFKIHAVSLTDNPGGNPAILPDALAPEVQKLGLDTLVHFSCRDLNRNAMESRLMALSRAGVHNLLVVTGDHTTGGFEGNALGVFDLDSVQAIKYIKAMNAGLEIPGPKRGTSVQLPKTNFFVAAAVSPFKYSEAELMPQFFKLEKKIAAGADFVIPQLGFDMRKFLEVKRYLASRRIQIPILGNVFVLSYGAARAMSGGSVPGCVVSNALLAQLEVEAKEADKGKAKRLERAAKMVAVFKGMGFNGVHLGGFALKTGDFKFIVEKAVEFESNWETLIPDVSFTREGEFYAFPPPLSYRPTESESDPVDTLSKGRIQIGYQLSTLMHRLLFKRQSWGCRLMTRYYQMIGDRSIPARLSHIAEFMVKLICFGCRDCGDCALPDTAYVCPQSRCAKQQRNGPCGGSIDGMCEVYPKEKPCAWTQIYERQKSDHNLNGMRTDYVPPRRSELAYTSSWANYYLNRDHASEVKPKPAAGGEHG